MEVLTTYLTAYGYKYCVLGRDQVSWEFQRGREAQGVADYQVVLETFSRQATDRRRTAQSEWLCRLCLETIDGCAAEMRVGVNFDSVWKQCVCKRPQTRTRWKIIQLLLGSDTSARITVPSPGSVDYPQPWSFTASELSRTRPRFWKEQPGVEICPSSLERPAFGAATQSHARNLLSTRQEERRRVLRHWSSQGDWILNFSSLTTF